MGGSHGSAATQVLQPHLKTAVSRSIFFMIDDQWQNQSDHLNDLNGPAILELYGKCLFFGHVNRHNLTWPMPCL